jgi:hypothetical protein
MIWDNMGYDAGQRGLARRGVGTQGRRKDSGELENVKVNSGLKNDIGAESPRLSR